MTIVSVENKIIRASQIIETKKIVEVRKKVLSLLGKKLVVFDFDNVVAWLGPDVVVGSDPWFEKHLHEKYQELGDLFAAEKATIDIFLAVHENTPAFAVEPETIDFIRELQKQQHTCVAALTARSGKFLSKLTRQQANSLNICFSNSQNFRSRMVDLTHLGPHCHLEDGYFYTGGINKGHILKNGLEALNISLSDYDYIVFIDDALKRVQEVQSVAEKVTNFIGFRYAVLDDHLNNLRKQVANI